MRNCRLSFCALATVGVLLPGEAASQQMFCGPRAALVERLTTVYGESQGGRGLNGRGALFEIWSAPDTGSWTILMTLPDGRSCVVADGKHWLAPEPEAIAGRPT